MFGLLLYPCPLPDKDLVKTALQDEDVKSEVKIEVNDEEVKIECQEEDVVKEELKNASINLFSQVHTCWTHVFVLCSCVGGGQGSVTCVYSSFEHVLRYPTDISRSKSYFARSRLQELLSLHAHL